MRSLQKRLKELGYLTGTVDGSFGAATENAVRAFQRRNGLTADGKAGAATLNKLSGTAGRLRLRTPLPPGGRGQRDPEMQQALKKLGYYTGAIDGSYGASTADAVRAFQIQNRLTPVDGVAGSATQGVLYSSDAVSASQRRGGL